MAPRALRTDEPAPLPDSDGLEGFAHPRAVPLLFGHERAEAQVLQGASQGRLHHGWIITGAEGLGKASLAYRLARTLLATDEERAGGSEQDPNSRTFKLIAGLAHPGLCVIRRAYNTQTKKFAGQIAVDDVRRLRAFFASTSASGGYRVVIVDQASDMTISAANALLKALEEPPPRSVMFLITPQLGRLLPTIRSRCRTLPLAPLERPDFLKAIRQAYALAGREPPSDADAARAFTEGEGSVGAGIRFLASGGIETRGAIDQILAGLPLLDYRRVSQLADRLAAPGAEAQFEAFSQMVFALIARAVREYALGLSHAELAALRASLFANAHVADWAEAWAELARKKHEQALLNLDRRTFVFETFRTLETVARGA